MKTSTALVKGSTMQLLSEAERVDHTRIEAGMNPHSKAEESESQVHRQWLH